MAVDEAALRAALDEVLLASGALSAARVAKVSAEAELSTASAAVDAAAATEGAAHLDLTTKVEGLKALLDAADD